MTHNKFKTHKFFNKMGILYGILIGITSLVGLILLIAAFVRKGYSITRDIVVEKSVTDVFNYIKLAKNQDFYNKWVMVDPNMKKDFRGTDGTVGFVYAWNGNSQAGEGELEIKTIIEGVKVEQEIRFVRPFKAVSAGAMATEAVSNGTKVSWSFSSEMKYPMNIMLLLNLEKMLEKDLDISLTNLKKILEK